MFRHISEDSIGSGKKVQEPSAQIQISRSVYDQENLHNEMVYVENKKVSSRCNNLSVTSFWRFFLKTFPIFSLLYNYKKEYLLGDIISGATVCSMHIPGMGHALLATLPPVVGIYMGFYPALFYGIFASSKHNSIGKIYIVKLLLTAKKKSYLFDSQERLQSWR